MNYQQPLFYKYRKLHATREYIFFSHVHSTFTKLDPMPLKRCLNKLKGDQHHISELSDHNMITTEINDSKLLKKTSNIWKLNNTLK